MLVEFVHSSLSFLTLVLSISLIVFLLFLLFLRINKQRTQFNRIKNYFDKKGSWFIFLVSAIATLGSLFYSEIAGYAPCTLCWYQRIFMYPLLLISGIMIWRKTKELLYVIISMASIGAIFAFIHYANQFLPSVILCAIDGANCSQKIFMSYGFITIPMMSLIAFLSILVTSLIMVSSKKKNNKKKN